MKVLLVSADTTVSEADIFPVPTSVHVSGGDRHLTIIPDTNLLVITGCENSCLIQKAIDAIMARSHGVLGSALFSWTQVRPDFPGRRVQY